MAPHPPTVRRESDPAYLYQKEDFRRRLWSISDGIHDFTLPFGVIERHRLETWFSLGLSTLALFLGWAFSLIFSPTFWSPEIRDVWFWGLYLIVASPVLGEALFNLRHGKCLSEAPILFVVTLGALSLSHVAEAISVLLLFRFTEILLTGSLHIARDQIEELLTSKPKVARVTSGGQKVEVSPSLVQVGEKVTVVLREIVPLDGELMSDQALFLITCFTGDGATRAVHKGERVLAGWQLLTSEAVFRTTATEDGTVLAGLFEFLESSLFVHSVRERRLCLWATAYTIAALSLAASLLFVPLFLETSYNWTLWLSRALSVLILAVPASLRVITKVRGFSTLSQGVREGIYFRSVEVLDKLARVSTLVADQTYTVTLGEFVVKEGRSEVGSFDEFFGRLAALEAYSKHPMAQAIVKAGKQDFLSTAVVGYVQEWPGEGITGLVNGTLVMAGNERLMQRFKILYQESATFKENPCILVAFDGKWAGYVTLQDILRPDASELVENMRAQGVDRVILLSGEKDAVVKRTSFWLGIKTAKGNLTDEQKAELVASERRWSTGTLVTMSNARQMGFLETMADVKIATEVIEHPSVMDMVDVVIFGADLTKVGRAIEMARENRRALLVRVAMSFAYKAVLLLIGALSLFVFWQVFFTDSLLSLLAVSQVLIVHKARLAPALHPHPRRI